MAHFDRSASLALGDAVRIPHRGDAVPNAAIRLIDDRICFTWVRTVLRLTPNVSAVPKAFMTFSSMDTVPRTRPSWFSVRWTVVTWTPACSAHDRPPMMLGADPFGPRLQTIAPGEQTPPVIRGAGPLPHLRSVESRLNSVVPFF